jgi:rod shape-determining protein MreD
VSGKDQSESEINPGCQKQNQIQLSSGVKISLDKDSQSSARVIRIVICLLIAAFLQTQLKNYNQWLGYVDWLLLITIYVALLRDPVHALITATAAGALQDSLSGIPLRGISGVVQLLAAWFASLVIARFFVEKLPIRIAIAAGAIIVSLLTRLALYFALRIEPPAIMEMNRGFLELFLSLFANLFVAILLYSLLDRFFKTDWRQRLRRAEALRGLRRDW